MIGFVGLGAAGGNIADEAVKQGFPGIAINYSQKDLESLEFVKDRLKLVGSEGVGKNREEAIRLLNNNWESAISFVKERYSSPAIEIIFVCFSTGGGSGSGMAPALLELLMNEMEDKTFVAVPILADLSEVMVNQLNCIQAFEELSNVDVCILPIDNEQQVIDTHGGKNVLYQRVNRRFIKLISEVIGYTNKSSKNGVMDKRDLQTILNTKGIATISVDHLSAMHNGIKDLTGEGVAKSVQSSWKHSVFVPIQYSRVMRAGIIFDGQESLMPFINLNETFKVFKSGMPIDLFEGYYTEDSKKSGILYTILTGLSWCNNRLEQIEKLVQEKQAATEELMEDETTYKSNVNNFTAKIRQQETKKKSVTDILSRYRK